MNPLIQGLSGTTPDMSQNAFNTNQGTNEDDSQSDPHPEAGLFNNQMIQNSGPEDGHSMVTGVNEETRNGHYMVTGVNEQTRNGHYIIAVYLRSLRIIAAEEKNIPGLSRELMDCK